MILVYSNSFVIHKAITSFFDEMSIANVYCFSNRIRFLTATTLLNHAWVIMDTVESQSEDIIWLHGKLRGRVQEGNIYYLIKSEEVGGIYSIYLNTISGISEMVEFIRMTQFNKVSERKLSLADSLTHKIDATLCATQRDLIRHEKLGSAGRVIYVMKHGNKVYLNRRYQLNKKLKIQTMQEFYCLIFMLNEHDNLTDSRAA